MTVEINNESGLDVDTTGLLRLADFALEKLRIHPQAELSIVCVDEDTMSAYHQKYMGEPGPTDVLSFPMDELRPPVDDEEPPEGLLGDIVLCPAVTARQAAEHGRTPEAGGGVPAGPRAAAPARLRPRHGAGEGRHVRAEGRSAGCLGHRTCPAQCPGDASPVNQADWIQLSIALLLAMLAGLMAAAEAALSSLTRARAERLVEEGRPRCPARPTDRRGPAALSEHRAVHPYGVRDLGDRAGGAGGVRHLRRHLGAGADHGRSHDRDLVRALGRGARAPSAGSITTRSPVRSLARW